MKKLLAIAALLLASRAAQAQYSFEYGGKTIRFDPDRGTVQIQASTTIRRKEKRAKESDRPAKQPSQQAKTDRRRRRLRRRPSKLQRRAVRPQRRFHRYRRLRPNRPPRRLASRRPLLRRHHRLRAPRLCNRIRPWPLRAPTVAAPAPAPAPTVAAVPPAPAPAAKPAPVQAANSPLGVWLTEEKEGKVRIEQCGPQSLRLFGRQEVEPEWRAGADQHEARQGQMERPDFRPDSGNTYDLTLALKGSDTLRVQGCAFGGMFCGGQTWTRVNEPIRPLRY